MKGVKSQSLASVYLVPGHHPAPELPPGPTVSELTRVVAF